ncbi:MAG: hypothetical protein RSD40_06330 [Bacilli bacterium]
MKYTLLKPTSYCPGVKRAIDTVINKSETSNKKMVTLGKLINNNEIIKTFLDHGVETIDCNNSEYLGVLKSLTSSNLVVFTAHGHNYELETYCNEHNIEFLDTTCDIIKDILLKLYIYRTNGYKLILVGKENHPETECYLQTFKGDIQLYDENKMHLSENEKYVVFAQTTISYERFFSSIEKLKKEIGQSHFIIENTLCQIPLSRQKVISKLSSDEFDLLVIIGSNLSSNTVELYNYAILECAVKEVVLLESLDDAISKTPILKNHSHAAIISGSSTSLKTIIDISEFLSTLD